MEGRSFARLLYICLEEYTEWGSYARLIYICPEEGMEGGTVLD